eukprot:1159696-Pelagomonas_calceolata.AAC.18
MLFGIHPMGVRQESLAVVERPPGDVCNERGNVFHSGHHHQPHKGHSLGKTVIPSCCLIAKGVNTESKSSHVAFPVYT